MSHTRIAPLGAVFLIIAATALPGVMAAAWAKEKSALPAVGVMPRPVAQDRTFAVLGTVENPVAEKVKAVWASDLTTLEAVIRSLEMVRGDVNQLLTALRTGGWPSAAPPESLVTPSSGNFFRSNLAAYAGRELIRLNQYDEAMAVLDMVDQDHLLAAELVDPASFYFHLASCRTQLFQREEGLKALDHFDAVVDSPERYVAMAAMLRAHLEALDKESLDGIAQDMRDVRRRLEQGKGNKPTQEKEGDILGRLDRIIEGLEAQKGKGQGQGSLTPDQPAEDSAPLGGNGEGKVDPKNFNSKDAWGNLPFKQREQALQDIGRQFPPHYRDIIQEYFRTLPEKVQEKSR